MKSCEEIIVNHLAPSWISRRPENSYINLYIKRKVKRRQKIEIVYVFVPKGPYILLSPGDLRVTMKLLLYNHFNISSSSVLKGETNNLERTYKAFESLWQIWMNHFLLQGAFLTTAKCFKILGFAKHKMNHNIFNTLIYKLFSSKDIFFVDTKKKNL